MERDALLTFTLEDGLYEAPVLQGITLEESADSIVGRWAHFGLEAEGGSAAEVYRDLLSMLTQRAGSDPSAPKFQPLAALVRTYGRMLPIEEIIQREDTWLREVMLPWTVSTDRRYQVALFKDVVIQRSNGEVRLSAFGITGVSSEFIDAFDMLRRAVAESCGSEESPGPRFEEISSWVGDHGQPVPAQATGESHSITALYAAHDDKLVDIEAEEIERLSVTDTLLLIQFWGDQCGWCAVQAPVLAELADEWAGRIEVRKINVDQHRDMARRFDVNSVPTVLLLQAGRELHRIAGHRGKATISRSLRQYLNV